jgi:hypothetical protein
MTLLLIWSWLDDPVTYMTLTIWPCYSYDPVTSMTLLLLWPCYLYDPVTYISQLLVWPWLYDPVARKWFYMNFPWQKSQNIAIKKKWNLGDEENLISLGVRWLEKRNWIEDLPAQPHNFIPSPPLILPSPNGNECVFTRTTELKYKPTDILFAIDI